MSLVLFADYTTGSSRNRAREYSDTVVTNGTFDTDVSGWSGGGGTIAWHVGGYAETVNVAGSNYSIAQFSAVTVGKRYRLSWIAKSTTSQSVTCGLHSAHFSSIVYESQPYLTTDWQRYIVSGTALSTTCRIYPAIGTCSVGTVIDIDNISVQEVLEATDTNTKYLHNIGLYCDTTTKVEYGSAYAISGDWSLETVVAVGEIVGVVYYYPIGVTSGVAGFFSVINGVNRWGFYDGVTVMYPESALPVSKCEHLVVTKTGTTYKFYRGGVLKNTLTGVDVDITQITVGMRGDGFGGMKGNIAYVREYGRVLTAEDVTQNWMYAVQDYGAN